MTIKRPTGVEIQIRKINFPFEDTLPTNWFPANNIAQITCDVISLLFPAGERFFIDSVRNYRNRITDPALQKDVAAFIAQESMHTQQHLKCNVLLKKNSRYAGFFERVPDIILGAVRIILPARTQLAVTCALEHFTALLAHQLLRNARFEKVADPVYARLWIWHAIEESEHKAVCFDVYHFFYAGVIGYIERCVVMFVTTLIFSGVILFGFFIALLFGSKRVGKVTESRSNEYKKSGVKNLKKLFSNYYIAFFAKGSLLDGIVSPYLAYYRPSFHPWQHDNSELLQRRKNEYGNGIFSDKASSSSCI